MLYIYYSYLFIYLWYKIVWSKKIIMELLMKLHNSFNDVIRNTYVLSSSGKSLIYYAFRLVIYKIFLTPFALRLNIIVITPLR